MARARRKASGRDATDEAFRVLRTNLLTGLMEFDRSVVLVTSAREEEGKTAVAAGLALALAQSGRRVVAIDLDLRHPNLHRRFGLTNERGMSDVLLGTLPLAEALQFVEVDGALSTGGLYVIGTGPQVEDPAELLGSARTGRAVQSLAQQADAVIIDTAPVLPVADTLSIGRLTTGAVLVIDARKTPLPAAQKAKDLLIRNQTRILGVVLNKAEDEAIGDYGYGYGVPVTPGADVDAS